jgi:hypothetical protein
MQKERFSKFPFKNIICETVTYSETTVERVWLITKTSLVLYIVIHNQKLEETCAYIFQHFWILQVSIAMSISRNFINSHNIEVMLYVQLKDFYILCIGLQSGDSYHAVYQDTLSWQVLCNVICSKKLM